MGKLKLCDDGCKVLDNGDVYHHPDCNHYPTSLSQMYDNTKRELKDLKNNGQIRLSFEELEKEILEYDAKNEYQQATIVILRTIFDNKKGKDLEE